MKYILLIMLLLSFEYLLATPNCKPHIQQDILNVSVLYNKWFKRWGSYHWSSNVATNKAYAFETSYAIINMIDENDMAGIKHIYEDLQKDKEHNLIFLNGIIGEPTFEKKAIDKANFKVLEFLLSNNIIDNNTKITDDSLQEYTLLTMRVKNSMFLNAKEILRQ